MFENIIIVISVILVIWASIFSWRMDNVGNLDKDKDENKETKEI